MQLSILGIPVAGSEWLWNQGGRVAKAVGIQPVRLVVVKVEGGNVYFRREKAPHPAPMVNSLAMWHERVASGVFEPVLS